jgi:hypothetical protein
MYIEIELFYIYIYIEREKYVTRFICIYTVCIFIGSSVFGKL